MKISLKQVLSKLPVFLFCVIFMNLYNYFFGTENSVIGVTILMGILMFLGNDFGYQTNQAAVSIFTLFIILAVAPQVAALHPILGLLVNGTSLTIIMMLSAHHVAMGNQLVFMMGYIFCQGYPVTGVLYEKRVISLVVFGALIALMYYGINRKKEQKRSIKDLFSEMNLTSVRTQWYIKSIIGLTLIMFVGDLCEYKRTLWVSFTALSLLTPLTYEHEQRRRSRISAAILGSILFFVLFEQVIPTQYHTAIVLVAGFGSMFMESYFIKGIYNSFSALIAAVLLFPADQAILLRIISNVIGVVVAVAIQYTFQKFFDWYTKRDYLRYIGMEEN